LSKKPFLRFQWSHRAKLHRELVKIYNSILYNVPFDLKYGIGKNLRSNQKPYSLVPELKTVVQVGAPKDTIHSGRSRGMYFCLFAGSKCKVIIVEPDPKNIEELNSVLKQKSIQNAIVSPFAAWSENTDLSLYVDRKHPATNFTAGCTEYDEKRMEDFCKINVPAKKLDTIIADLGIKKVDLVSITTNGSEWEIIDGMSNILETGLQYLCIASGTPDDASLHQKMKKIGFEFHAYEDRGCTFSKIA
jgi:FkbM family methyltransferase